MALVQKNGKVHYYRNVRRGRKVSRVYVGCGEIALRAAALDRHRRLRRQMEREALLEDRRTWNEVCVPLDRLIEMADLVVAAVMLAEGYHLHHGEWSRRMDREMDAPPSNAPVEKSGSWAGPTAAQSDAGTGGNGNAGVEETKGNESNLREALQFLVNRASAGDATVMPELRKAVQEHSGYFEGAGNLAQLAESAWLDQIAGTNLFRRGTIRKELERMRPELLGPNPTRSERLLAERVTICWLQAQYLDMQFLANINSSEQIRNELTKRQESAQRRLTSGIKQLTLLQKTLRPRVRSKRPHLPEDPLAAFQERAPSKSEILRIAPETEGSNNGTHVAG
jgi:hypothetical protein